METEVRWKEFDKNSWQDTFVEIVARFKSRKDWKATPPAYKDKLLVQPIPYVVFSSIKVTGEDANLTSAQMVKEIQKRDMDLGMSDIQCNFLVSEDGLVWEGRGWDFCPGSDEDYPGYEGRFLEITNINDFTNPKAKKASEHLIDIGVLYKFIAKDFKQLTPDKRRKEFIAPKCVFDVGESPDSNKSPLIST